MVMQAGECLGPSISGILLDDRLKVRRCLFQAANPLCQITRGVTKSRALFSIIAEGCSYHGAGNLLFVAFAVIGKSGRWRR